MMMVFLKSTVRPWLSVMRPSSSTWKQNIEHIGCAFSTSSKARRNRVCAARPR